MIGLFIGVSALFAMVTMDVATELPGLVVMALVGIGFGGAGLYWWRFVTGSEVGRRREFQEKTVLGVASRHGGCVTLAQIALETELSTEEARVTIERLCGKGLAQPDIREDGSIEYRFGGLLDR